MTPFNVLNYPAWRPFTWPGVTAGALSAYAVLTFEPKLVFDFQTDTYKTGGAATTFPSAITHTATTNATMIDSDGLLKWRPHNLQVHSGDFSNSAWSKSASTVDTSYVAPDGTSTASKFTSTGAGGASGVYDSNPRDTGMSLTCFMKAGSSGVYGWIEGIVGGASSYAVFDLESGTVVHSRSCDASIEPVGNDWFRCVLANTTSSMSFFSVGGSDNTYTSGPWSSSSLTQGKFIYAWGAQLNRSDLGGMVNNPDASTGLESYVPTANTNVYLSRRGHHIYNGTAWVNEGILHESEARTNLLTYSNDFTNGAWAKTNMTVTANQATGPDGTVSAAEIERQTTGAYCINSAASTTGTLSYFAKQNTERFFVIVRGVYGAGDWAVFDLSNGTVSKSPTHTNSSAHMVPMGNGWYRCVLQSAQASTVNAFSISGSGNTTPTPTSGTVYLWGPQLETGLTPSSYIPTGSATATRAAETLTVPAASLPYDNTNMSIQLDGKMTYADSGISSEVEYYRWLLDGTNYINCTVQADTNVLRTGELVFAQRQSTTIRHEAVSLGNAYSPDTNVPFNIASRNGSSFINGAHEGTLLTANTAPTALPNLSSTDLVLGFDFMGTIGQFRMWDEDITDAGITEAST